MQSSDLLTVYTVNDAIEAQIIKNALEAEGIPCVLAGVEQASTAALPGTKVLVQVAAGHAQHARDLIASHDKGASGART
jgi:hypothetical protein